MSNTVMRSVYVRNPDTGQEGWLHEGDEVPDWAEGCIKNDKVFQPRPEVFISADGAQAFTLGASLKEQLPESQVEGAEAGSGGAAPNQEADFDAMSKEELQELLRERDLPVSGNKDELIERLRGNDNANG